MFIQYQVACHRVLCALNTQTMKKQRAECVAITDTRGDKEDIAFLARRLALKTPEEAIMIVEKYYDPARILPRSIYLLDEIFEEMK